MFDKLGKPSIFLFIMTLSQKNTNLVCYEKKSSFSGRWVCPKYLFSLVLSLFCGSLTLCNISCHQQSTNLDEMRQKCMEIHISRFMYANIYKGSFRICVSYLLLKIAPRANANLQHFPLKGNEALASSAALDWKRGQHREAEYSATKCDYG